MLDHRQKSVNVPTLRKVKTLIKNRLSKQHIRIGKPGGEYEVIHDVSVETLKKFRLILIEFHGLDYLVDEKGFELIRLTFKND